MLLGLPFVTTAAASSGASLAVLKGSNAAAFIVNMISVSVPGRMDGAQDQAMRQGDLNPSSETPLTGGDSSRPSSYVSSRARSIVTPAGWAFAIWGPIYLGEGIFVASQLFSSSSSAILSVIPSVTPAFVAANLFQSLWCASFRPSYVEGWKKYISVGMLAGTAYSLSLVQAAATPDLFWYFVPLTMHFGWTTAATLVNLNGSVAMGTSSDTTVVGLGHGSVIAATALGVGITLQAAAPVYGLTIAWALAACSQGASHNTVSGTASDTLKKGAGIQKYLCLGGAAACLATSIFKIVA
jgi:hypothetical protein